VLLLQLHEVAVYPVTAYLAQGGHSMRLAPLSIIQKSSAIVLSHWVQRWSPLDIVARPTFSGEEWVGRFCFSSPFSTQKKGVDRDEA
jgi:hypothetical protein